MLLPVFKNKKSLDEPGAGWTRRRRRLGEASELPEWYEAYPYIKRYYRVHYTVCDCAASVMEMHNETCNIWTHLVGTAIFAYRSFKSLAARDADELTLLVYTSCACFMLAASTSYHAFHPVSPRAYARWLVADKLGIALMLGGSYAPGVWLGFRCALPWVRLLWLTDAAVITCVAAVLVWQRSSRFRTGIVALVVSSLAPIFHWLYIAPTHLFSLLLPKLVAMLAFYALGLFFYTTQWPERRHPGLVDLIGASHQCWHLCILAAALTWLNDIDTCLDLIREAQSHAHPRSSLRPSSSDLGFLAALFGGDALDSSNLDAFCRPTGVAAA